MGRKGGATYTKKRGAAPLRNRAVLFLEQTTWGELARRVKEQLARLEPTLGYNGCEKSHMVRHQRVEHQLPQNSTEQTGERCRKDKEEGGAASILNSKGEFNQWPIPRLVVEEKDVDTKLERRNLKQREKQETHLAMEQVDCDW